MRAKFIGTDGSMGIKAGEIFNIKALPSGIAPILVEIRQGYRIWLCPYNSFESLFENWEFIYES